MILLSLGLAVRIGHGEALLPSSESRLSRGQRWEDALLSEVNRIRAKNGLRALRSNPRLQVTARNYSQEMARLGYFGHVDLDGRGLVDRMRRDGILEWCKVAENLAKRDARSSNLIRLTLGDWLDSRGHRRNILNPQFTETGVGAAVDSDGNVIFCQIFMAR